MVGIIGTSSINIPSQAIALTACWVEDGSFVFWCLLHKFCTCLARCEASINTVVGPLVFTFHVLTPASALLNILKGVPYKYMMDTHLKITYLFHLMVGLQVWVEDSAREPHLSQI